MAFLPAGDTREPTGLILTVPQVSRRRQIEAARAREAQEMVAKFFGLSGSAAAR